jgi:hypothetical protein
LAIYTTPTEAGPILFDFDGANYLGLAPEIETYMEGIYGSDITVGHAIVGNGIVPGVLHNYPSDRYLQNKPSGWKSPNWLSITFVERPITAVSFDWGVELDAFHAEADGVEFFQAGFGVWSSGSTGTVVFAAPVSTLVFHNTRLGEVQIDNLAVTPVPIPSAIMLGSIGLVAAGYRLRKHKRKSS